jgi:uncharacterized protein YqeY
MNLIETISNDFMTAYKAKEIEKKDFLGVLKTEITKESKTPEDALVISKIKSMIKSAEATNSLSEFELNILEGYLPKQLTNEQLTEIVSDYISENENANMGQIMGFLKDSYNGQYDGRLASTVVKELLQ